MAAVGLDRTSRSSGEIAPATPRRLPMHAECDVAAMVYTPTEDPDLRLGSFFDRRLGEGWDVVGLLQERLPLAAPGGPRADLRLAGEPDWRNAIVSLPAPPTERDPVARLGDHLVGVLDRRPDLLVLNRFGRREACGRGLYDLLGEAVERELPVLIAVPEALFSLWTACAAGLAVRLAASEASLEGWWSSLGFGPRPADPPARACEAWK